MSCTFKIREGFNSFTKTEKNLAKYILENKEEVINLSTEDLSAKAKVSAASVIRFSKTLGYKGFTALKVDLAKDTDNLDTELSVIIENDDSTKDVIEKVKFFNTSTIEETIGLLNTGTINDAIEALINAKKIYLFGIGASGLIALDFQYKLLRINKNVIYQMDSHIQLASSVHIGPEDVAIGISYSGESKEVNVPIKFAQEQGAKIITITKYSKNSLSKLGDYVLYIPNEEKELRVGAITSRIATLTLTDILYLGIAKYDLDNTKKCIKNTRGLIKNLK